MASSAVPVSSPMMLLIALFARAALANDPLCTMYESRTVQEERTTGLITVMEDLLYLELRNCKLEFPLSNCPSQAHEVTLANVTFGEEFSWDEVLPLNISGALLIENSTFENENILDTLTINNIATISILNSELQALPKFNVTDDCLTKRVNLSRNSIFNVTGEAFQDLYSSCQHLEDLDLTRNSIRNFPKFVAQNLSKCKLHLEYNPLSCTENDHLTLNQRTRDMLIRTPHCEKDGKLVRFWFHDSLICTKCDCYIHSDIYVNCSGRGLSRLPKGLPRETTHLDVSGNDLTSLRIPENSHWREYQTVKHLNASRNPLTRIDDFTPHICNLMMLDVSSARLENLPESLIIDLLNTTRCVPLLSVGRVLLGHNPWKCDCKLLPFKRFLGERAKEIVDFFSVQCGLDGPEVYRIQEDTLCPPPFYELNPWDVAIVIISVLIIFIIYKTFRDYRRQKHTGKLPKFFEM